MKRFLALGLLAILAVASIVLAQQPMQATLRTPSGDTPVTYVQQEGQWFFSANEVMVALGGSVTAEGTGSKVTLGTTVAAFGPDSRYAVVADDLIEMPVAPIIIDGNPYVPWQFFQGLVRKAQTLDVTWDANAHLLSVKPIARDTVAVQASVANVQGISKIVLTLSGPAEYTIVKEAQAYVIRFRNPIRPPFNEQTYDDPHVQSLAFSGNQLRVQLTAPEVVADAYQLENPFRIVMDVRKAAQPAPGVPVPITPSRPVDAPGIRTIVIDPGHGGKEVGAVGPNGLMEKDVTLEISRKLATSLARVTGARVVLTREDDSLVSLDQRTAIANQYKADLFLSVHMNAAVVPNTQGSETYFLSLEASDEVARRAAEIENAAGGGSTSDLELILWDLAHQKYHQDSSRFATAIQEAMNAATGVQNRGVKQAPFKVLVGATMPAALVEVAFISNPDEEAKLRTEGFQTLMIEAITRAVQRYKIDYETRIGLIQPPKAEAPPAATATQPPATPPARTGT